MPKILDNIDRSLLPELQGMLKVSQRADFSVGYFNLRGWKCIDSLVEPLIAANPSARGHRPHPGRPRRRPEKLHADKGYDYPRCRSYLHRRGIKVRIARRGIEDKTKLGCHRWVVERTFAWLLHSRRLARDYERLTSTDEALIYATMTRLMARRLARTQL